MLSWDDIQRSLAGAWRLMFGRTDGLRYLDLSIDGFWNSFFAMAIALPPMLLGWISLANDQLAAGTPSASRPAVILAAALVDLAVWLLPLVGLALLARRIGIADRFVAYVVSTNWASAIAVWIMLPVAIVRLLVPSSEAADVVALVVFIATSIMMWRLTNAALGKGPMVASGVFIGVFAVSVAVFLMLSSALGIVGPSQ